MRAEFYREGDDGPVGTARWTGSGTTIDASDADVRSTLSEIFRPTPVAVDDPALRPAGAHGETVLPPGTLAWFTAAARVRGERAGLTVRLAPEGKGAMGWDPAAAYRSFSDAIERKERLGAVPEPAAEEHEAGEEREEGARGPSQPGTEAAEPSRAPSSPGASREQRQG